jgi:ADP-ribose pyrophosphatase YjhB (NUDIX family)
MASCPVEKEKVLVYVTRTKNAERLLLIFAHRDYPEAGWQVPGGTLEIGEDPGTGALREIEEEAGLTAFLRVILLGQSIYLAPEKNERHLRHFYRLECPADGPDRFQHTVSSGEEDEGLVFLFSWRALTELTELAAEQGAWFSALAG